MVLTGLWQRWLHGLSPPPDKPVIKNHKLIRMNWYSLSKYFKVMSMWSFPPQSSVTIPIAHYGMILCFVWFLTCHPSYLLSSASDMLTNNYLVYSVCKDKEVHNVCIDTRLSTSSVQKCIKLYWTREYPTLQLTLPHWQANTERGDLGKNKNLQTEMSRARDSLITANI